MARYKPIDSQMSLFNKNITATTDDSSKLVSPSSLITPTTIPGDLWHIGPHRLMCGNSADPDDMRKLLDSNRIQLIHTDPPYNVKVQPQSKDTNSAKARKLEGDFISPVKFTQLLHWWFNNMSQPLEKGRSFYIWGGYSNMVNYLPLIKAAGLYFSHAIIWVKSMSVFTRKDFMGKYEICFYGWKEGANHQWHGPNNITDVWEVPNIPRQQMVHLTEKPVEIPLRAIKYSSEEGENVLDIFGGSGSTLIAADQLKRNCFLMEIDPMYCDVIVNRCKGLRLPIERE